MKVKKHERKTHHKDLFRGDFALPYETAVLVPSTKEAEKPISKATFDKRIARVRKELAEDFGGYTSFQATGVYVLKEGKNKGGLVKEPVVRVVAFGEPDKGPKIEELREKVKKWARDWGQESVGVEHEGDLFYVQG